jgi:hypothetical protein
MRSFMSPYRRNVEKKELDSLMNILINNKTGDGAIKECRNQIQSLNLSQYKLDNFTEYVLDSLQINDWTFNDRSQLEATSIQLKEQAKKIRDAIVKKTDARRLELGKKCLAATYELKKSETTDVDYRKFLLAYVSFRVDDSSKKGGEYYKTGATLSGVPIINLYGSPQTLNAMKEIQLEHADRTMGFPNDYTEWKDKVGENYAKDIFSFASKCLENYLKPLGGYVPKITFMVKQDSPERTFPGVAEMIYVYAYAYGLNSILLKGGLYEKAAAAQSTAWRDVSVIGGPSEIDTMFNKLVKTESVEAFIKPIPQSYKASGTLNRILAKGLSEGSSSGPVKKRTKQQGQTTMAQVRPELQNELSIILGTLEANPSDNIRNFLCHHISMLMRLYEWNEKETKYLNKAMTLCQDYTAPKWSLKANESDEDASPF